MISRKLYFFTIILCLATVLLCSGGNQAAFAAGTISIYDKDSLPGTNVDLGMMVIEVPQGLLYSGDTFTLTLPDNLSFNTSIPVAVGNNLSALVPSTVNVVYPPTVSGKENAIIGGLTAVYSGSRTVRIALENEPAVTNMAFLYIYLMGINIPADFRGDVKIDIRSNSGWPESNETPGGEGLSGSKTDDQVKPPEPEKKKNDTKPVPTAINARFKIGEKSFSLNGSTVTMDTAPFIMDNRTYVPVRYVAKASGIPDGNISFENNTVTIKWGNSYARLVPGSSVITLDSMSLEMDVPVQVVDGRTFVPLRWVCEAFGLRVSWNSESQTVTIFTEGNKP